MKIKVAFALILSLLALAVNASPIWTTDNTIKDMQIAKVTNATGQTAGVICFIEAAGCEAYVALDATCDNGEYYPLMINSPVGAYPIRGKCTNVGNTQVLAIQEFDNAIEAFQSGDEIGFALPMASGAFKVVRFPTAGATLAITRARTLPKKKETQSRNRSVESL